MKAKPARNLCEVSNWLMRRGITSAIIIAQVESHLADRGKLVLEVGTVKLRPNSYLADEGDIATSLEELCDTRIEIGNFVAETKAKLKARAREKAQNAAWAAQGRGFK